MSSIKAHKINELKEKKKLKKMMKWVIFMYVCFQFVLCYILCLKSVLLT